MNLVDTNLTELLNRLTRRERKIITDALREGAQLPADVRALLRWLRRRLKRKARAERETKRG